MGLLPALRGKYGAQRTNLMAIDGMLRKGVMLMAVSFPHMIPQHGYLPHTMLHEKLSNDACMSRGAGIGKVMIAQ
jgi:hypothetical protein